MVVKKDDAVVKIDFDLLESIEEFINLDENKFKYVNRKQFIDIAVAEYLLKVRPVISVRSRRRRRRI